MNKGFSTLELMVAMMVLTISLSATVLVILGLPNILTDGQAEEQATTDAYILLQRAVVIGMQNFSAVTSIATTSTHGVDTSLSSDLLSDGVTKRLSGTAGWIDTERRRRAVSLTTLITNFTSSTNTCNSILAGDWSHPVTLSYSLDPTDLLPSTDSGIPHPIDNLSLGTTMLIASISIAQGKLDSKLFLFDLSSSTKPSYLGDFNNASSTIYGVAATAVNNSTLYVASAVQPDFSTCTVSSSCSQLQIIDISTPSTPTLITNYKLPTLTSPFAIGSRGQASGKSIFATNDLIYLGLTKPTGTQGDEFNIIDVHNPHSPQWLGGFRVGRTINQIQVLNGYAYLATDDPARELIVLDVHNPASITLIGSYDASGSSTFGFGKAITLARTTFTNNLALGRSYTASGPELFLLNMSDLKNPLLLGSQQISSRTSPVSVEQIVLRDFLGFILTDTALEFWNITDPEHLSPYAIELLLPGGESQKHAAFVCRHNTLYVASDALNRTGFLTIVTGS